MTLTTIELIRIIITLTAIAMLMILGDKVELIIMIPSYDRKEIMTVTKL